jgi:hypothetical protein
MIRNLGKGGTALFVAGLAAALGFGASQAFAGVADSPPRDRCTDGCRARYSICIQQGEPDCYQIRQGCLESCTLNQPPS